METTTFVMVRTVMRQSVLEISKTVTVRCSIFNAVFALMLGVLDI